GANSSASKQASTPRRAATARSHLAHQLQRGRRLGIVRRRFPLGWNLYPAVHAFLAFLHHREVKGLARLEIAGQETAEHELVVVRVRQITAAEPDLGHALGELGTMKIAVAL